MIRSLWTAATGMNAQDLNISNISNNLANVSANGFKKTRVDFQDLLYQTLREAGTPVAQGLEIPTGIQIGHGTRPVATQKIFIQGEFIQTENPLDMVIEGDGFFQVLLPTGELAYTRDGAFKKNGQGQLVTSDGYFLQPEIIIPENAMGITIGTDGTVSAKLPNQIEPEELGQVELARFVNPSGLRNIGRNLMVPTNASGAPVVGQPSEENFGTIAQGFLEASNVKVVEEMVNMITAQRAYEVNSKAIQTSDQMLGIANSLKR